MVQNTTLKGEAVLEVELGETPGKWNRTSPTARSVNPFQAIRYMHEQELSSYLCQSGFCGVHQALAAFLVVGQQLVQRKLTKGISMADFLPGPIANSIRVR